MARPLRVNVGGGWYHVMHRGIERRTIFEDVRDHEHFLELLGEVVERYRFVIHAYCLLGNHYHCIIETPDGNLSQGMQWLGQAYSSWFNARHNRVGPLFQGRFRSVPIEGSGGAYELSLYIHLNPVMTLAFGLDKKRSRGEAKGIVPQPTSEQASARLKALRKYPWNSYRVYGGYTRGPKWLRTVELLRRASRKKAERIKRYREDVRQRLERGVDPTRLEQFRDVVAIGSAQFIERMQKMAGEGGRETERRGRLRERASFEEIVCAVERAREAKRSEWLGRHGDPGKWIVLRLARHYTGLTLAELGCEMGAVIPSGRIMDYAAVSTGLRWFEQKKRGKWAKTIEEQACSILNL
jgi:putative transposase